MSVRDGGKGDTPRPLVVSMEVFDANFDKIFGKKQQKLLKDYVADKSFDIEVNADNDGQQVTVTKTWEF